MLQRLREWIAGLARKRDLGPRGERIAARYLRRRGLRVLDRNVRVGGGEIDIVALDGDSLVFVEVKSRTVLPGDEWTGLENIDRRKQEALSRASTAYRRSRRLGDAPWRLDAVTVAFSESGRLESVRWYPAVFELDG